jgi:hypothetical protein
MPQTLTPEAIALEALTTQLLEWVEARPRTYGEAMEAWKTSCPRMPVWEDAISDRLVETRPGVAAGMSERAVQITPLGLARLGRARLARGHRR